MTGIEIDHALNNDSVVRRRLLVTDS